MLRGRVGRHAAATPDRIAVVAGGRRLTYEELDAAATGLSASLRAMGIGDGTLVALYLPRTAEMIIGMLGVLGAGAAYTIVEDDGDTVENRSRLVGFGADAVLTTPEQLGWVRAQGIRATTVNDAGHPVNDAGHPDVQPPVVGHAPAYVTFTSGSTGVAKGVVVTHDNIRHYVEALLDRLAIDEPLAYAHVTTFAADLGNTCLFPPLWTGGTIHVIGNDLRRDPAALFDYLRTERIDVLKITPSYWTAVFRATGAAVHGLLLRYLILGGEKVTRQVAADAFRCGVTQVLVNHYGPTETTIGVAAHVLTHHDPIDSEPSGGSVPVGRPLGATRFLVRTADGELARSGVGELYVSGPQVAAGYRDDPEGTAAAFVTDLVPGDHGRSYRTGDLVRIDADGVTEFLGRTDHQVKVHGYRVELEQVEAAIRQLDGVVDVAVFHLPTGGGNALVAVVAAVGDTDTLRARLAAVLPRHMVPARVVPVAGELPRTSNGKTDRHRVRGIADAALSGPAPVDSDGSDQVRAVWRRYLGAVAVDPDTDFFDAGGSSLDAIQVIADLQGLGHPVTARSFLAAPTIRALSAALVGGADIVSTEPARSAPGAFSGHFSAAQQAFLDADFAEPNYWNQAILLQTPSVDPGALGAAVADLVRTHPLLHTAFRRTGDGWRADPARMPTHVFEVSTADNNVAEHVQRIARRLHATMDLTVGRVFAVHLVCCPHGQDQIVFVAHHLCVDAVSWRILFSDLRRAYAARVRGGQPAVGFTSTSFWEWAAHVACYAPALTADFRRWRDEQSSQSSQPRPTRGAGASASADTTPTAPRTANREADAETAWIALSMTQTERLASALGSAGLSQPGAVLAAFVQAHGSEQMTVDVESHGRASLDDNVDVSRVVGWFTATYPVTIAVVPDDLVATTRATTTALDTVPDLGIGHGLGGGHGTPARILYNFLGRFHFGPDDDLQLSVSRLPIGPARGGANDRGHDLKLTARVIDEQLVVDLSYHPGRDAPATVERVLQDTRRALLALARIGPVDGHVVVEPTTSSGLLAYAPPSLWLAASDSAPRRRYREVVMTGATGYLGIHLLQLLIRAGTHVHCVVRADSDGTATQRLAEVYDWYFPGEHLRRVTVRAGDAAEPGLGLAPDIYHMLSARTDAVYHLAADTRLFATEAAVHRNNVESVRAAVRLASIGRPKDLHYTSTLAVAGVNDRARPVRFAEDNLDIGQEFQNAYERSKFVGEQLVHEFVAQGGSGFIYRAGNVSGDSRTGRFQRNAGANRLVQTLRAVIRTGQLPHELTGTVALSPVDTVTEAIMAISTRAAVAGGTFHVDSGYTVSYREVFDEIRAAGYPLETTSAKDLTDVLTRYADQADPEVALGLLWLGRRERNVHIERARTLHLLAHLGICFQPLDRSWLRRYILHLVDEGHLGALTQAGPRAGPRAGLT